MCKNWVFIAFNVKKNIDLDLNIFKEICGANPVIYQLYALYIFPPDIG